MAQTLDHNKSVMNVYPVVPTLDNDMFIIRKLDDEPNDVGGLSADQLKAEFDKAGEYIKEYINNELVPAVIASDLTEQTRAAAEAERVSNEQERVSNENIRETNENARVASEQARVSDEQTRVSNEQVRTDNEAARNSAEKVREDSEAVRKENEIRRENAETGYVAQAAQAAQTSQAAAASASASATSAQVYADSADNSRSAAQNAQAKAESARDSAVAARNAAVSSSDAARAAEITATSKANDASTSAQQASGSATAAKQSETNAKDSETAAKAAQAAAEAAAGNAARDAAAEVENRLGDYVDDAEAAKTAAEAAQKAAEDARDEAQDIAGGDFIPSSQKGAAGGVASLGNDGKVPAAQLPDIGSGDMAAAVYDPQGKARDVFAYADTKLSLTGGTLTGALIPNGGISWVGRAGYIAYPMNAFLGYTVGTGAIKITLPIVAANASHFIKFTVGIYYHGRCYSEYIITLNPYKGGLQATTAYCTAPKGTDNANLNVRFGVDEDGMVCVFIGELDTAWNPVGCSVIVSEVHVHPADVRSELRNAWGVALVQSFPTDIRVTVSNTNSEGKLTADSIGAIPNTEPVPISLGGTGAASAADARNALGVPSTDEMNTAIATATADTVTTDEMNTAISAAIGTALEASY